MGKFDQDGNTLLFFKEYPGIFNDHRAGPALGIGRIGKCWVM